MSGARLSRTLGALRFYQQQGQSYADMLRGTFTASTFVTAVAFYLGMGQVGAVVLGAISMVFWVVLSVVCGWCAVRWHVYKAERVQAWQADPLTTRAMELLEKMAAK